MGPVSDGLARLAHARQMLSSRAAVPSPSVAGHLSSTAAARRDRHRRPHRAVWPEHGMDPVLPVPRPTPWRGSGPHPPPPHPAPRPRLPPGSAGGRGVVPHSEAHATQQLPDPIHFGDVPTQVSVSHKEGMRFL